MTEARENPSRPIIGVGAVIFKGAEILLIQRGKPPKENEWSLPGGAQEIGETVLEALKREILEETGLTITPDTFLDVVDYIEPLSATGTSAKYHYTLLDYSADYAHGTLKANSDAKAAAFFSLEKALALPLWTETKRIIKLAAQKRGLL